MPLRAEHRKYYGRVWKNFRLQLIEERGSKCSSCGRFHDMINGAHLDHDPRNPASVALMCPSCHARHDSGHRLAIMRRSRAGSAGQLWLSPEMEWAPFTEWEIPGRVFERLAQMNLFQQY